MNSSDEKLTGAVQDLLDRVGGLPHPVLATAFLIVGLASTAAAIRAALLCHPACRRPWVAIATTLLLWTAGYIGVLLGLPTWCIALVAHPLSLCCVSVGILAFPGVRRSASGWALVMLDGWMSVGGVATTAYIVLQPVMEAAGRSPDRGMVIWAGIDFLFASLLAGLMVTAPARARRTMIPVTLAATGAGVGDLCLALTGETEVTVLIWILVTGLVGLGPLIGGPDLFLSAFAGQAQTRMIKLSQLPLVPAVVFLFLPFEHDLLANIMAGMVIAVAFGNVAMHSKQNAALVDRVRQQRDRLAVQARTDPLTGLLNRSALMSEIGEQLSGNGRATLLFIDLDEFKAINDTLGHAAGDDILIQVAQRLRTAMGGGEGVARLGGDEFAVLVPPADQRDPAQVSAAILAGVAQVRSPEHLPVGRASIGIASGPAPGADDLLRDADLAMYQAKKGGGQLAVSFEPWMRERMLERSRLRARLETAIDEGELSLALQPVVDLATEQWCGFEALVRWPEGSVVRMPDEFLPLAEETGLIVPLGAWVLRRSLRLLADWDAAAAHARPQLTLAVNVSPRQLDSGDFGQMVLDALGESGTAPHRLTLEITEQTAVQDFGSTASQLTSLRAAGVHVAIDDFGTGYSSLKYLTRLPVDALKIDKQFVAGLGVRSEDEVLVTSMLRLAADLGLDVIAEGVETPRQAELLRAHGCRLAQGYLYSRPIPMADVVGRAPGVVPQPRGEAIQPHMH